jgi:hypothetical protein
MAEKEQHAYAQSAENADDVDDLTYTEAPPPTYKEASASSSSSRPTALAYRPFPALMNGNGRWSLSGFKFFFLCGASEPERLCLVELHTGFSGSEPLGNKPDLILYNGLTKPEPILAAACESSALSARASSFNITSVILMRPVGSAGPFDAERHHFMNEPLSTGKTAGAVSFAFSVEVTIDEKVRRQRFE